MENQNQHDDQHDDNSQEGGHPPAESKFDPASFEIIVKGVNYAATEDDIHDHFEQYGPVLSVNLLIRHFDGKSKGTCFVKFETEEGREKAISETGSEFMGRKVWIEKTRSREERLNDQDSRPRGGGRGRGRGRGGYNNYDNDNEGGYNNNSGGGGGYVSRGRGGGRGGGRGRGRGRGGSTRPKIEESKLLFVGNLSYQSTRDDIWDFFEQSGEIYEVRLVEGPDGRKKGFGFIEFATYEAAKDALRFNGTVFDGRELRVDLAEERRGRR